jgi:hypothetical protein
MVEPGDLDLHIVKDTLLVSLSMDAVSCFACVPRQC